MSTEIMECHPNIMGWSKNQTLSHKMSNEVSVPFGVWIEPECTNVYRGILANCYWYHALFLFF
jgi:hypothetical protein